MYDDLSEDQLSHYQALGHLCAIWASLDRTINSLLQNLLGCPTEQVACIATVLDPVASRCALARQLIYTKTAEQWWIADYLVLINAISNVVGPLRNRCIHDSWEFSDQAINRIDRRAKLSRQGAHEPVSLTFDTRHTMATQELTQLIDVISVAAVAVLSAVADLENHPGLTGLTPERSVLVIAVQKLLTPSLQALQAGKPYRSPYVA